MNLVAQARGVAFLCLCVAGCQSRPDPILDAFQIHPDFAIALAAKEPLVFDPVDLEFDEQGRAFVIEMPGYPFMEEKSRVVLLEDKNRDGVYDERQVFCEDLNFADAILPYRGGLLVAAPPDLIFIKDTDGDNKADVRETWLTGFAVENPQHNFNGLTHGLDNWIYGANGGNSGKVFWPGDSLNLIPMRDDDYRMNFALKKFERLGASAGGFGFAFDAWGRIFGTHNLEHISQLVIPARYLSDLPSSLHNTRLVISDHEENGLSRIFPIGPQETRVNHPEQSGYFSGACGITFYGGNSFPTGFNGNMFVMDVVLNLVHQDVLSPEGARIKASRGLQRQDFLASSDRGFRPVNMALGPDGALYLLDMHRDVIEHPEWIPDDLEKNLDVNAGKTQGRIFRITPKGGLPQVQPRFERGDLKSVVAHLGHRNKWWRDTAQRLLVEWKQQEAAPLVQDLFTTTNEPLARLHALWTLHGLRALSDEVLLLALKDEHAGVRENALQIAEERLSSNEKIFAAVLKSAGDADARVRLQTALALSVWHEPAHEAKLTALSNIAERDAHDPWTRLAVLSAAKHEPLPLLTKLVVDAQNFSGKKELLGLLALHIGQRNAAAEVAACVQTLAAQAQGSDSITAAMLENLATGLESRAAAAFNQTQESAAAFAKLAQSSSVALARAAWRVGNALGLPPSSQQKELLREAARRALEAKESTARRLEYLALLELAPFKQREAALYELLDAKQPRALQLAALKQLSEIENQKVGEKLLARWQMLGPEVRGYAGDLLLFREENHQPLLAALEKKEVALGELNFHLERLRALLFSDDAEVKRRAEALINDAGVITRQAALEQMRPALALQGNAQAGREVYKELCAKCHRVGEEGEELGPNLTEIFRKSAESVLHDVVDPNAAVETKFLSHVLRTQEGEFLTGIIVGETDTEVVLASEGGVRKTVRREQIVELSATGLSQMPEGLEEGLSPQKMADLLAFLLAPR